jgi:hypothetical protein
MVVSCTCVRTHARAIDARTWGAVLCSEMVIFMLVIVVLLVVVVVFVGGGAQCTHDTPLATHDTEAITVSSRNQTL